MPRATLALTAPLLVAAALTGCGSSSKSSSSSAAKPAGSSTAAASSGGAYGAPATTAAAPASSGSAATQAILISSKQSKLGTILAGRKGLTLYMFEADKTGASACTGACAQVWPPVVGTPHASGHAAGADLGTIMRADGRQQVTYKGHPLYYFAKDGDSGDAYGQGIKSFGAAWYVLAPSGNKVDKS